jgi:hypothetical protein
MASNDKVAYKQMRILRLRYDELNKDAGRLVLKVDMESYIDRLQGIVNRALKNSGFDKQPIYVDRKMSRRVPASQIQDKGKVMRR